MNKQLLIFAVSPILIVLLAVGYILKDQAFWLLGAIFFVTYTLSCIAFGFWLGQYSFKEGARVTLEAQRVNDEWDVNKTQALSRFGTEVVKMARLQQPDQAPGYLPFEPGKVELLMSGFDDDE